MVRTRSPLGLRWLVAMAVLMLGLVGFASTASAEHQENGVCHALGNGEFQYIEPAEVSGHLDDNEDPVNPGGQSHEDDRAATEEEFEAEECLADEPEPTPETPVDLPDTGVGSTSDPSDGMAMTLALSVAATVLMAGALGVWLTSTRNR